MRLLTGFVLAGLGATQPPPEAPIRYELYQNLISFEIDAADALSYNAGTWNTFTNPIELQAYSTIEAMDASLVANILNLGMDEEEWDCWVR